MPDDNLPPCLSHTAPPLPASVWSLPNFLCSWEKAGSPASVLPALPGDQYCLLACFPNKRLHAPSLLTHLCLGEASHAPPPNHFLRRGVGEQREPGHLLYPSWGLTPLDCLVLSTSPVARAAAWLPARGDVHPWEGAIFCSFAAQQDPAAPQGLCLHGECFVKNGPISSCAPDTRCGPGLQDTKGSKAFYYYSCHQETSTPEEKQACAC